MRPLWTGSLSFGLINIPVKLYPASDERGLDLDMLHKDDHEPIRFLRVCRKDGEEVPIDEIVKGYKMRGGEYIVLSDEDLERAHARKTATIDIMHFAHESEIDPAMHEKPFFLEPAKGAEKAYVLLREALRRSGKVGVATFVLRNREHLAAISPSENALLLHQLRFFSELRSPEGLHLPQGRTREEEVRMALALIEQLTRSFDPIAYRDTYTEELKRVIGEKARGKTPTRNGAAPTPTKRDDDVIKLLRKSLRSRRPDVAKVRER
jgi:DNA end-binding protein Ku